MTAVVAAAIAGFAVGWLSAAVLFYAIHYGRDKGDTRN